MSVAMVSAAIVCTAIVSVAIVCTAIVSVAIVSVAIVSIAMVSMAIVSIAMVNMAIVSIAGSEDTHGVAVDVRLLVRPDAARERAAYPGLKSSSSSK